MKWLIVFKKEEQLNIVSLLMTLQCEIIQSSTSWERHLDEDDYIFVVNGPDNLIQLAEPFKDKIEIWCNSKAMTAKSMPDVIKEGEIRKDGN